jgi:hypothetical protein
MKAYLVRVGIDLTPASGNWVAPVDPVTYRFAYVPILENETNGKKPVRIGYGTSYSEFRGVCDSLGRALPRGLLKRHSHLDPDFAYLTYGDERFRGKPLLELHSGDILAFYASLQPVESSIGGKLVYALIGLFIVDRVILAQEIPEEDWHRNAHTRREPDHTDIVAFGKEGLSGKLDRCIPIGRWRDGAYRVTPELLDEWGGLSVKNGWIQRSAVLPQFRDPQKFYDWFKKQKVRLVHKNT